MNTIAYIIPYFGKLPPNFPLWLLGCDCNRTINWIILTDDHTQYNYPPNVKVIYSEFETIIKRINKMYDFDVLIDRPWRLSLFKPAYGEIFFEELKGYVFWGHCDIDLMWGDIRKFYTDDILAKYNRIGFLGHSTLYRNTPKTNSLYRALVPGGLNYIDIFSGKCNLSFDENGMDMIYDYLRIPYFKDVIMADLEKYESGFVIGHKPIEEQYKNKKQIFTWNNGKLFRHYLVDSIIYEEEFMYVHFFCRPMKYKWNSLDKTRTYYIYPDVMTDDDIGISKQSIQRYGSRNWVTFIINSIWYNRHKITIKRIISNFRNLFTYYNNGN